jgi:hypothetical protein
MLDSLPDSRRLLEKLIREVTRTEMQALEHPVREAKRIGDALPVQALRDVARHAAHMRPRFEDRLTAHGISLHRPGLDATLATLRQLVVDRVVDAERSFRTSLLDLRHGIDVVSLLRELVRQEELFGVIRWCDDWLGARRTLVARAEAQLAWYAAQSTTTIRFASVPVVAPTATPPGGDLEDDLEVLSSTRRAEQRPRTHDGI